MKYLQTLLFVLFLLIFTTCNFDNDKKEKNKVVNSLEVSKDSTFVLSDTYSHAAKLVAETKLVGEAKFEDVVLYVEVYSTLLSENERIKYLKRDSVRKKQLKDWIFDSDPIDSDPIEVDYNNPIRNLNITFEERTEDEELPLFEDVSIVDEAREMHIPKKGLVIKF